LNLRHPHWNILHGDVWALFPQPFNCFEITVPEDVRLEEFSDVDNDAEDEDGDNVEPTLSVLRWEMERVADSKKSLQRYGDGHKNRPTHPDVGKWIEEVRKHDGVGIKSDFKSSHRVINATTRYVEGIKEC